MNPAKLRQVAQLWALALLLSTLLAAAGERWPEPLPIRGDLVWVLVLLPPLLTLIWLLRGWSLPPAGQEGESGASAAEQP
jgi:hypothetical protein